MALNFPSSPTNGQIHSENGIIYKFNSSVGAWIASSVISQNKSFISNTAPVSSSDGALWYNTDYGKLFIYYTDNNSSQWVDVTSSIDTSYLDYIANNYILAFNQANAAFDRANLSNDVLFVTASFDKANAANVLAYNTGIGANSYAGAMANAANAYAASLTPDLSPAFNRANTAWDKANAANVLASAAFDKANTGGNSFATISAAGQTSFTTTSTTDTLTFSSNGGINIETNPTSKTVYISTATLIDYGLITGSTTGTTDYGSIA